VNVDWNLWVEGPGLPPVPADTYHTKDLLAAQALADGYIALGGSDHPANFADFNEYYPS
jgi:hypothetical protein